MANVEWEVAHDLVTPAGTILFNQIDSGRFFRLTPDYKMVPSLRVTADNISQADGSVLHPHWKTGMTAVMKVEYQTVQGSDSVDYTPACAKELREMNEQLSAALNSIREFTGAQQRLIWSPSNDGVSISRRMLDDIQVLSWLDPSYLEPGIDAAFAIETPFPYAVDLTQIATDIADGASEVLTNVGTADFFPVVKVFGPFTGFVLTNTTTGLELSYDGTRPGTVGVGSSHYAEFDFFRGTVFLDGNSTDLIAGVDPAVTDFFPLVYLGGGTNDLAVTGADATVLWNPAWS